MELRVDYFDCTEYLLRNEQPITMFKREPAYDAPFSPGVHAPPVGIWYVPQAIWLDDKPIVWDKTITSELVRVPLYSYTVRNSLPQTLLGFGVQLGAMALVRLPAEARDKVACIDLVIGNVWQLSAEESKCQAWLGVAIQTK